jgi:tripartite-type tricarboxylate transporter receptor subunit TctC
MPSVSLAEPTQDWVSGRTQLMCQLMTVIPALSRKRSTTLPELPTTAKAGMKGLESSAWFCVLGPTGTPRAIVAQLYRAIYALIAEPAFHQRRVDFGVEPMGAPGADFDCYLDAKIKK